ncbi:MAG: nitroreductase family protein, partial [Spirochaetaceae bacterium]|nr:nitroreductase family protein [Spirochaetaceae bacterium]
MTLYEAISVRISTRSFDGEELSPEESEALRKLLSEAEDESDQTPFGNRVRLALAEEGGDGRPIKMGTYGLISGASAFLVPAVQKQGKLAGTMEDVGWIVEKLVLALTALGYASCWIGGVFSRAKAGEVVNAAGEEIVPVVIALGWPAGRRKVADKVVAVSARARSRKPLDAIVFLLSGDGLDDVWLAVAEAVREAPSASNKQPWRLVRLSDESRWLLFLDEDKIYNNGRKDVHLQNLDLGIAMR